MQRKNVAVLGSAVAQRLFPLEDPLGKTIRVGQGAYVIAGVVQERRPTAHGKAVEDFNSDVYLPLETCQARFGERVVIRRAGAFSAEAVQLHQVLLTVGEPEQIRPAVAVITSQLQHFHAEKDWEVWVAGEGLK